MTRYSFSVRLATRRDVPALLGLVNEWYKEDGEKPIKKLSDRFMKACFGRTRIDFMIVAEDDEGLVGYAHVHPMYDIGTEKRHLMLEDLFVTKSKRSRGIGAKIMSAVARLAKQEDAAGVVWMVHRGNRRGTRFYAAQGAEKSEYAPLFLVGKALTAKARPVKSI